MIALKMIDKVDLREVSLKYNLDIFEVMFQLYRNLKKRKSL